MQVWKCDRCSKYYDNNDIYMDRHLLCDTSRNPIDLCPDCRAELNKFVEGVTINAVEEV